MSGRDSGKISKTEVKRLRALARRLHGHRGVGYRNGLLTETAVEILDLFLYFAGLPSAVIEPGYAYLRRKLKRSNDAISEGLKRLRRYGFLRWKQRNEPSGRMGRGPQVYRETNSYTLLSATAAERKWGYKPVVPDDHDHACYVSDQQQQVYASDAEAFSLAEARAWIRAQRLVGNAIPASGE